jgi:hypothetical protein
VTRDWQHFREFEKRLARGSRPDVALNFRLANAMYDEARRLGIFPLKDPLEGLDVDIRVARAVNFVRRDPDQDSL